MNSLHVLVDISGTELLLTQVAFFGLGLGPQVPLDVVLEILNFVDSTITEGTLEARNRVVYKRMFPISIDSKTDLVTNRTLTRN